MTNTELLALRKELAKKLSSACRNKRRMTDDRRLKKQISRMYGLLVELGAEEECQPDEYPCETGCCKLSAKVKAALQGAKLLTT